MQEKLEEQFLDACKNGNIDRIKELIQQVDPSKCNNWAIRRAAEAGKLQVVKLLLQDPRVNPSVQNNHAIRYASLMGHLEIVKLLLQDPRVDPSDYNNSAINWSSCYGYLEIVKLLLKDPRVDSKNAIKEAKFGGHTEIVELLTQHQYQLDNPKYKQFSKIAN